MSNETVTLEEGIEQLRTNKSALEEEIGQLRTNKSALEEEKIQLTKDKELVKKSKETFIREIEEINGMRFSNNIIVKYVALVIIIGMLSYTVIKIFG